VRLLAAVAALAVIALLAAALIPSGGSNSAKPFAVATVAGHASSTPSARPRNTKVFGSNIPAKQYGTQIARQENQGVDANGQLISDLSPISPAAFNGPITAFRVYAEGWAATLAADLPRLRDALAGGGRAASERAWSVAYSDYLHLGAVYGLLPGTLDARIDGMPHALPGDGPTPSFSGLHRVEYGLWTGASPRSLVPWAKQLERDVVTLRRVLPKVPIDTLDFTLRAHEILEDAQRDLLSGTDVPWSGAGVLGTAAGLAATRELIATLTPLLQGRDNTLGEVQSWLPQLQGVLDRLRAAHGGTYPSLGQLSTAQREQLDGAVAGTLQALSLVPGTLETTAVPDFPKLPVTR
jgi:iron uptake system EfeUOB component EfeO/EfeM